MNIVRGCGKVLLCRLNRTVFKWKTGPWAGKHQRVTSSKEEQFVEEGDVTFKIRANEMHLYTDGALSTKKNQIATGCAYVSLRVGNQKLMVGMRPPEDVPLTIMAAEAYGAFAALQFTMEFNGDVVLHTDSHNLWEFFHIHRHQNRLVGFQKFENSELLRQISQACHKIED